jgi:hypothetical protein
MGLGQRPWHSSHWQTWGCEDAVGEASGTSEMKRVRPGGAKFISRHSSFPISGVGACGLGART